jgi:hypothetical protein
MVAKSEYFKPLTRDRFLFKKDDKEKGILNICAFFSNQVILWNIDITKKKIHI